MVVIRLPVQASLLRVVKMKDASFDGAAQFFYLFPCPIKWLTMEHEN